MECDFCSSPEIVIRYECRDFDSESKAAGIMYAGPDKTGVTNVVLQSHGYWAACATCSALVDAVDLNGLVEHAMVEQDKRSFMTAPFYQAVKQHLRRTYRLFFENRIADAAVRNSDE